MNEKSKINKWDFLSAFAILEGHSAFLELTYKLADFFDVPEDWQEKLKESGSKIKPTIDASEVLNKK